jgi:hypothetical protein
MTLRFIEFTGTIHFEDHRLTLAPPWHHTLPDTDHRTTWTTTFGNL